MKICWVTNEKRYSRIYRWIFREDASHVGAVFSFDNDEAALAVDLNRPWGRVWDIHHWFHKYTAIWTMELVGLTEDEEWSLYRCCRDYASMRQYDMNAYWWGMLVGLRLRLFGGKKPPVNAWSLGTGSTCQEIIVPLLQHPTFQRIVGKNPGGLTATGNDALTPGMIRERLIKATKGKPGVVWTYNG